MVYSRFILFICFSHVCASSVARLCPTLCNPMDCSLLNSSVHGIFQARKLKWVAISYSRGSSWPKNRNCVSYISCILYHCATCESFIHSSVYIYCINLLNECSSLFKRNNHKTWILMSGISKICSVSPQALGKFSGYVLFYLRRLISWKQAPLRMGL